MTQQNDTSATVEHEQTVAPAWHLGDAIWWRDRRGIHCLLLSEEPVYAPRGGLKQRGTMTTITADTMRAINDELQKLGFARTRLRLRDIKWTTAA